MDTRTEYNRKRKKLYEELYKKSEGGCFNCGVSDVDFHIHHNVPLSLGGSNHLLNLSLLCLSCHGKIHQKDFLKMSELSKRARRQEDYEKMPEEEILLPWMLKEVLVNKRKVEEVEDVVRKNYYISAKDRQRLGRSVRFIKKAKMILTMPFSKFSEDDLKRVHDGDYQFMHSLRPTSFNTLEIPSTLIYWK